MTQPNQTHPTTTDHAITPAAGLAAERQKRTASQTARLHKADAELLFARNELQQARQQVQQTNEYLQAVLNHSPAAIGFVKAVFDTPTPLHGNPHTDRILDYILVAVNDKFAHLAGQPIRELVGQPASRVAEMLWHSNTYAKFHSIIMEEENAFYQEREHHDETGQRRWVSLAATKHDGGVVLTSLDLTELRQTQQQREALRQQVSQSEEVAAQLAMLRQQVTEQGKSMRTSSHDLRSSLGVVQAAAHLLNLADSDEERLQLMDMLHRNAQDLTRLLTELVETTVLDTPEKLNGTLLA